jgi:hypothetical protein
MRMTGGVVVGVMCALMSACSSGSSHGSSSSGGSAGSSGGTSSSSSSSSGSSSSGGTPFDAGPDPSCAGYAYCDDFESYSGQIVNLEVLGPWKASVAGATMTVDSINPYRGSRSLHVVVNAPDGGAAHGTLHQQMPDAGALVAGNDLFGRAMLFYSALDGNGLPLNVHSWIFNSDGFSQVADGGVTMNLGGGGAKLQINYHPPAPLPEASVQGGVMTAGVWHCVQWEYNGSGSPVANDAKVWVDGTLAVEAMPTEGWNFATPWNAFDFGFTHYQNVANGVDVYLDDFALDGSMVPCP